MTSNQTTAWLGIAASVGFAVALAAFAALDPAYSHATKAISELGVVGAPNQLAWNLTGFLAVGLALAAFGWRLGQEVKDRATGILLALFGLAFAATAIPADFDNLRSPGSAAHIVASQGVLLFWLLGLIRLLFIKRAPAGLRLATVLALILAAASIVLRGSELVLPGIAQRVSFAVVFGWVFAASLLLLRPARVTNA